MPISSSLFHLFKAHIDIIICVFSIQSIKDLCKCKNICFPVCPLVSFREYVGKLLNEVFRSLSLGLILFMALAIPGLIICLINRLAVTGLPFHFNSSSLLLAVPIHVLFAAAVSSFSPFSPGYTPLGCWHKMFSALGLALCNFSTVLWPPSSYFHQFDL